MMNYSEKFLNYPITRKVEQVDNYHGTLVTDYYQWLEDLDSEETKAWVKAQKQVTLSYLNNIPGRGKIKQRLTQLWNYEKHSIFLLDYEIPTIPFRKGEHYFYFKNKGLENQSILYTLTSLEAEPKVLLDPNQLSEDGTVSLARIVISPNGKFMAYGLSTSGSIWQDWKVRNVETGEDLADNLKWIRGVVRFSGMAWTPDNQGFFYSGYDEPLGSTGLDISYYQKIFYHRLGTPQSEDILIYYRPDRKQWRYSMNVTEDGRYLIITVRRGSEQKNLIFYKDLTDANSPVVELINEFEAKYDFINNDGSVFWFCTDLDALRGRAIAINIEHPARDNWQEIIPQADEILQDVTLINNQFVANYLKDARSQIKIFDLQGKFVREVELPGIGSAGGFGGSRYDTEAFYSFTTFTTPTTIYRYNMISGESTIFHQPNVDFNPADYETKQVFYSSKDGMQIPMFITHKKGLQLDGNNPTYMYGFGGFGLSMTPGFSVGVLAWIEMGGVYIQPNLRGGGEYGEEWHQAGTKLKKQTVFNDFIAAAEWLIANNYTRPEKLAIGGTSEGGLLVSACMTQRPDLFGAVLPNVAVIDMLRFHKFSLGWSWCSEYGSPENPEEFQALYAYSPLHNIKPETTYPATLITTAENDDVVLPAHSFKFAAALQAAQVGEKPILLQVESKAGHGPGKPIAKTIEEIADKWAFLVWILDMEFSQDSYKDEV